MQGNEGGRRKVGPRNREGEDGEDITHESGKRKEKDVISSVSSFLSIGQKHVVWL